MSNRENHIPEKRRLFVPSLSFDGVAMIMGILAGAFYVGQNAEWKKNVDTTLSVHASEIYRIQEATIDLDKRTYNLENGRLNPNRERGTAGNK